jgi:hypothetical protein
MIGHRLQGGFVYKAILLLANSPVAHSQLHRSTDFHWPAVLGPCRPHYAPALHEKNINKKHTANNMTYLSWFSVAAVDLLGKLSHGLGNN